MLDVGIPVNAGAVFSPDRVYRYSLWRIWDRNKPIVLFILLNPSTADEVRLDPTLTRCKNFAMQWGYGGMLVGNIFALKSTNPKALYISNDPIGPENDEYLLRMIRHAAMTVVGWGVHGSFLSRGDTVLKMIPYPYAFGLNEDGTPKHPLYLSKNAGLIPLPKPESSG